MLFKTLVAAVAVCGVALSAPVNAADPVKIGFAGPLSGGSIDMGESMRNGARLAVEEINNFKGGVLGRPILLVERDDAAKADVAVSVTKDLIQKEKVVAVIGFANTGPTLETLPEFQAEIASRRRRYCADSSSFDSRGCRMLSSTFIW